MRRVFLTSIPKCGTHLLLAFLENLGFSRHRCDTVSYRIALTECLRLESIFGAAPGNPEIDALTTGIAADRARFVSALASAPTGSVVAEHCPFDAELLKALRELDYVVLFMIRDPRDQVISYRNHVLRDPTHKNYLRFKRQERQITFRQLLIGSPPEIEGESNVASVSELYRQLEDWLYAEGVTTIAFENLVGAKGNGSRLRQLYEADRLCALVEPPPSTDVDECLRAMFDEKHSLFVRGQIGVWREEFSVETAAVFERECAAAVAPYMQFLASAEAPGLDDYTVDAGNIRRAWRLAERDLAAALAGRFIAQARGDRFEQLLVHALADSRERLDVIRRLERRVIELKSEIAGVLDDRARSAPP